MSDAAAVEDGEGLDLDIGFSKMSVAGDSACQSFEEEVWITAWLGDLEENGREKWQLGIFQGIFLQRGEEKRRRSLSWEGHKLVLRACGLWPWPSGIWGSGHALATATIAFTGGVLLYIFSFNSGNKHLGNKTKVMWMVSGSS